MKINSFFKITDTANNGAYSNKLLETLPFAPFHPLASHGVVCLVRAFGVVGERMHRAYDLLLVLRIQMKFCVCVRACVCFVFSVYFGEEIFWAKGVGIELGDE